ncbi:MAG: hypothetical protein IJ829_04225 [Kiritimatiellae bacterium]|nr:hypothetical protein [Kiritimatiellia bacterium]
MTSAKIEKSKLGIHLDVGHDSIGWCVTRTFPGEERFLAIPGAGVVLFPANDCLANSRRTFRRQRRHIRATRQRIARMKSMILSLGVLTDKELSANPTAAPWKLAAQSLAGGKILTWLELWCVLRWYAHNRGYDGNILASAKNRQDGEAEDIKKNKASHEMMKRFGTSTMAETMCAFLGVDPEGEKIASRDYFKGSKVSFDRSVVVKEVSRILEAHKGKLPGLTDSFVRALVADPLSEKNFLRQLPDLPFHIQNRFWGGVLFGQLAPRFDNRIIGHCPVSGKKLPLKSTPEFLEYRWARVLANIRVGAEGRRLSAEEIAKLNSVAARVGGFAKGEFKKAVKEATGEPNDNVDAILTTPEADASLSRFPGVHALAKLGLRDVLDEKTFRKFANQLFRGKALSLAKIAAAVDDATRERVLALADPSRPKGRAKKKDRDVILHGTIKAALPSGRAPYARAVMRNVVKEIYAGKDPTGQGGVLYRNCVEEDALKEEDIDRETNNHLIRHRVKILLRLLKDIVHDYAENNPAQVAQVTIEMARDLKDLSGKTNKQIEIDLRDRTRQHLFAAKKLASYLGCDARRVSPGLIRKVRIAEDMGWQCPYTGHVYDLQDIVTRGDGEPGCIDKDHILPRSKRMTDSLDSLVLTYREVNEMKGARTGLQFIRDCAGMRVPGRENLVILSETQYKGLVDGLKVSGHSDDQKRQKRRKQNLLRLRSDDAGMTEGMLTRTSFITTLAIKAMRGYFAKCGRTPDFVTIPGRVTAMLRKEWNILGLLAQIDPRVKDENGNLRLKQEIRSITHMHHAVDAITLGLAATYLPHDGTFLATVCKRRVNNEERAMLDATGIFRFSAHNEPHLVELPTWLGNEVMTALAEQRVVVHQPQERAGLKVQQNAWGVEKVDGKWVTIHQRTRDAKTGKVSTSLKRVLSNAAFGLNPVNGRGKLKAIKGVLLTDVNYGIALMSEPQLLRHHRVWGSIAQLKDKTGGKMPQILRRYDIIRIASGGYAGVWRVASVKDNESGIALTLVKPYALKYKSGVDYSKDNVSLKTVMENGLSILKPRYTGVALCPTT